MHNKRELCFHRLLCALALGCIGFLGLTTVYSSDDYAYSLYFDDGLLGYLPKIAEHYRTVNGRNLVHVFAHGLLEFPTWVFALVCLGCVLGAMLLVMKDWKLDSQGRGRAMAVYLLLFLAMPAPIMTQGVMWVSAFCNYVIPCVMVCWLIHLVLAGKSGWAIVPLAALCGATTEQMGAVTVGVLVLLAFCRWRQGTWRPGQTMGSILGAAAGYATIFLSPSTQGRLLRETKVTEPGSMAASLLSGFRRQTELLSVSPAAAVAVSFLLLAWGWCRRERRWVPAAAVMGTAAVWVGVLGSGTAALIGWATTYVLLAVAGLELSWDRWELPGVLVLAAVASACIMLPTESNRSRCFLPMYMLLSLAAALLTAKASGSVKGRYAVPVLAALLAFSCVSCAPVLAGYWHNYRVDRINGAHVAAWEPGEPLLYCMDYDKRYTDSKPYDSGGAYEDFYLQTVGLDPETVEVCYYGADYPQIRLSGKLLRFPAYEREGLMYLPLRPIVETAGGTVTLEGSRILVTLGEKAFRIDYILRGRTNVAYEGGTAQYECTTDLAGFYLEERFYAEFLGLTVEHTPNGIELEMP